MFTEKQILQNLLDQGLLKFIQRSNPECSDSEIDRKVTSLVSEIYKQQNISELNNGYNG